MESSDLKLIEDGLLWLSENIEMRAEKEEATQQDASIYAERQLRVVRRILNFVESQEDAQVILLRKLLELKLHEDIKDLSMIAILGKTPIEEFDRYIQKLITQNIFGEGSRWN